EIARQPGRVPPTPLLDCRDRADTHALVVPAEPVGEVVPRAQVTPGRRPVRSAEVRRLVPAVAGAGQSPNDALEVVLHRVGLAGQLLTVGMGEARPRLGLELVAREVLGSEREPVA